MDDCVYRGKRVRVEKWSELLVTVLMGKEEMKTVKEEREEKRYSLKREGENVDLIVF